MPLIVPTPWDTKRLRRINVCLAAWKTDADPRALSEAATKALEESEFRNQWIARRGAKNLTSVKDLMALIWAYLYFLLGKRDYVAAAMVLWDKEVFTPEPHCVQLMLDAMFNERMIAIIGGGGQGKTYVPSAWLLMDWVLDPEWTRVQLASNTEDHLIRNLFADIQRLHADAVLPLPGVADAESISLNKKKGMGIFILTIPGGTQSKGKIRGAHTKARPAHPLFGTRSRTRMLIDEAQEVAQNIYPEIPNRFSTASSGDNEHIKFIVCANPKDPFSPFGQSLKPEGGFQTITMPDETWRSERGWYVISLNAMNHENVIARKEVYPGFVTYEGTQVWLKACNGDPEHPDMYTYVYGKFPPQGTTRTIIGIKDLQKSEREWIFDGQTENFAYVDWGYSGDLATIANARSGRAIGWHDYQGNRHELPRSGMRIQIDVVGIMDRGDTQDLADEALDRSKQLSVKPHGFGDDRTGLGQGPHDIVRRQWKQKVGPWNLDELPEGVEGYDRRDSLAPTYGIHFAEEATRSRVAEEDSQLPVDMYDGIKSEVWYVFARLCELDIIGIGRGVDQKSFQELGARRGSRLIGKGKKLSVEPKDAYKARTGNPSPDRADSIVGVVHVARLATQHLVPRARDTTPSDEPREDASQGLELGTWDAAEIIGLDSAQPSFNNRD